MLEESNAQERIWEAAGFEALLVHAQKQQIEDDLWGITREVETCYDGFIMQLRALQGYFLSQLASSIPLHKRSKNP